MLEGTFVFCALEMWIWRYATLHILDVQTVNSLDSRIWERVVGSTVVRSARPLICQRDKQTSVRLNLELRIT